MREDILLSSKTEDPKIIGNDILDCSLPENSVITDTEALMDISQDNDPSKMKQGILSAFSGVFLNQFMCTWGVVTFLRLGYVVGQAGFLLTMSLFLFGYAIGTCTTVSQAILATNDRNLQGGGAYFLVSRAFGPVFGGSMGLVYHVSNLLGGGFSALGLMEFLRENFGIIKGSSRFKFLPEGEMNEFLIGSIVLLLSLVICISGTKYFCKALHMIVITTVAGTLMMYISLAFRTPGKLPDLNYMGPNWNTFSENLWPAWRRRVSDNGTSSVTGNSNTSSFRYEDYGFESEISSFGYFEFSEVLAIIYPACTGVLGGSSMSGDLQNPGTAIPIGSVMSLIATFFGYMLAVFLLAAGVDRSSLITNSNIVSEIAFIPEFIQAALFAICFFCLLGTIIGEAKMVEAIAKDKILPGMNIFTIKSRLNGEPIWGMVYAWFILECCLLLKKMDLIAPSLTILTIFIYLHINLSCYMLASSKSPNFRPQFKLSRRFQILFSGAGVFLCVFTAFITDFKLAILSSFIFWILRMLVARYGPDRYTWGDVRIAFHENVLVQKLSQLSQYMTRNLPDNVTCKYWKPSMLLLSSDHSNSSAEFFKWLFGKFAGLTLSASFKPTNDGNVKILDSRNKCQSLIGIIKYHGFGPVTCNTVILDQDLPSEILTPQTFQLIVREERKNIILPINIDKFEELAKGTGEKFIDVWLLGKSRIRHQVKCKRGSSLTGPTHYTGKSNFPLQPMTPLQETGMVDMSDEGIILQSVSDSVYDYGLSLQLCEFLRSKDPKNFKVRLFVVMANSEPQQQQQQQQRETVTQIKNLFRSIMLPIPVVHVVRIEAKTTSTESKMQWLKWNLLNPRTRENTAMMIVTLEEEMFDPTIKEFKELGVPMLLVKGSQSTIN